MTQLDKRTEELVEAYLEMFGEEPPVMGLSEDTARYLMEKALREAERLPDPTADWPDDLLE
jgi:hypothetical protein